MNIVLQLAPAVPSQPQGLRTAPSQVVDRMTRTVPGLYFDLNSHTLPADEPRLAQLAGAIQDMLRGFPDLIVVIEGSRRG